MTRLLLFIFVSVTFFSCDWAKQKAKNTVNKTGQIVAETGSEFTDGVAKGIEKTFKNKVTFSKDLEKEGFSSGKIIINSTDSSTDNILTVYTIFDKDFNREITIKVMGDDGQEYGRVRQKVEAKKGEAKYVDFVFDSRTNIDGKGEIIFE